MRPRTFPGVAFFFLHSVCTLPWQENFFRVNNESGRRLHGRLPRTSPGPLSPIKTYLVDELLEVVDDAAVPVGERVHFEACEIVGEAHESLHVDERNDCPHSVKQGRRHLREVLGRGLQQRPEDLLQHPPAELLRLLHVPAADVVPGKSVNRYSLANPQRALRLIFRSSRSPVVHPDQVPDRPPEVDETLQVLRVVEGYAEFVGHQHSEAHEPELRERERALRQAARLLVQSALVRRRMFGVHLRQRFERPKYQSECIIPPPSHRSPAAYSPRVLVEDVSVVPE